MRHYLLTLSPKLTVTKRVIILPRGNYTSAYILLAPPSFAVRPLRLIALPYGISGTCHILLFNIHPTNQSHININISERLLCCVVKQSLLYILDVRKTICGSDNHFVLFFYYIVRTVQKLYIIEPSWLSRTTRVQLNVELSN